MTTFDGVRPQFLAAIRMLENAVRECPDDIWADPSRHPPVWALAHHTLFWLDLYLTGSVEGYAPPPPFGLEELDPSGTLPPRVYSRDELLRFAEHCRAKCDAVTRRLGDGGAERICEFGWGTVTFGELLIYNLRHVQHGAAQLNLILRQETDSAPAWVGRCESR